MRLTGGGMSDAPPVQGEKRDPSHAGPSAKAWRSVIAATPRDRITPRVDQELLKGSVD